MQRRIAELQAAALKASAYFDSTVPAWGDPLPTEDVAARMWRLTCKALAQRWECLLLEAYQAQHGGAQPTAGYKGQRVFLPFLDVDQAADLLRDVRWLMRIGAPGVWHGRHIVQLPEADWVVPLDHPSVRYRQSQESTPAIAQSQESPVPSEVRP
jgi:hypothetical protein